MPCTGCKKPSIRCECGLREEEAIQENLRVALKKYEDNKDLITVKIKLINQLTALMAGTGPEGHCTYDQDKKQWIPGGFFPSPKGTFDWECIEINKKRNIEFILDSVSQLNLVPMKELRKQ